VLEVDNPWILVKKSFEDVSRRMRMALTHEITLPSPDTPAEVTTASILFIGTATMLIRYAGFTVLTDPNFIHRHEQVDLGYGLSATRQTNPALDIH
jgi:hypothetical protein